MSDPQPNNPLHGVTLKTVVEATAERHSWAELAERFEFRCFSNNPSVKSTLKFLRKTDWARAKIERLYLEDEVRAARNKKRNKRRSGMRAYRAAHEGEDVANPELEGGTPPESMDGETDAAPPETEGPSAP